YRNGNTLDEALAQLEVMLGKVPELQPLIDSVKASTKGILR
ncbi:MAG TPA: acyl-[acyl-carrier-protein]--UDP-N-acetylglucosamine O-acyltransferase, partial [Pseudomonadaceae bacterium]|nr:acyl-[acyl-carrier-protein]--UDP-N-acetylglucosamine O-acyltransferase [Pseudomonadaceae bacterium]